MTSKRDLQNNIKVLRSQVTRLEVRCAEREDKLVELILAIGKWIPALPKHVQAELGIEINKLIEEE